MSLSRRQKRKQQRGPRRKRMTRAQRLQNARATGWVGAYGGKDVVAGYGRWYGVDEPCAILELRALGVAVTEERQRRALERLHEIAESRRRSIAKRAAERARLEEEARLGISDDTFAFIVGYTSGGAPYGTTWEELEGDPFLLSQQAGAYDLGAGDGGDARVQHRRRTELSSAAQRKRKTPR